MAPPWVRRSRPCSSRRDRSARIVGSDTRKWAANSSTVTLPRAFKRARALRRRSSAKRLLSLFIVFTRLLSYIYVYGLNSFVCHRIIDQWACFVKRRMRAMFVYVGFAQPDEWPDWAHTYAKHMQRFEAAAGGERCICIPFDLATPDLIHRINPTALVLSGFARSFQDYKIESFFPVRDVIDHAGSLPMLALCGSHQLLGFMYNGALSTANKLFDEPMRKRKPGE